MDTQAMTSPNHHASNSPQPELATMTNVNVLDLHKDYGTNKGADSIQYIYSSGPKPAHSDNIKIHADHLVNGSNVQRVTPGGQVIDGRIPNEPTRSSQMNSGSHVDHLFEKMGLTDEQILRLIGTNGESQQIVSREIINGEPHILTRSESGEHILTRIVTADPKLTVSDNAIYATVSNEPNDPNDTDIVYTATSNLSGGTSIPPPLSPTLLHSHRSVLQYSDAGGVKGMMPHGYTTTTSAAGSVITTSTPTVLANGVNSPDDKAKPQIIYASNEVAVKEEEIYGEGKVPIYGAAVNEKIYDKPPIDLIYEEGGKTVIYTTTSDPKGLELYSSNELSLINSEGQVIVQGGLQYATQQINGQTVFVVSEQPLENEIIAHQQHRLVHHYYY